MSTAAAATADSLAAWIKDTFDGFIVSVETSGVASTRFVPGTAPAKAYTIRDEQYPFGGRLDIGAFQTDGALLEIYQWCTKYEYLDEPMSRLKAVRDAAPEATAIDLADPNSLPIAMDRIIDIGMDYCRLLYRKSIKAKRRHLKPLVHEIMEMFQKERRRCRTSQ